MTPLLAQGTVKATTGAPGSSAAVQLPDPSLGRRVRYYNSGATLAFVALGKSAGMAAAAATDTPVAPGAYVEGLREATDTHVRAYGSAAVDVYATVGT